VPLADKTGSGKIITLLIDLEIQRRIGKYLASKERFWVSVSIEAPLAE
jgi:sensor c-di-GMP phosphodiesterase-like protein